MPSEVTVKTLIEASVNVTCGTQKERQHAPCFTGLDPDSHTSQLAAEGTPVPTAAMAFHVELDSHQTENKKKVVSLETLRQTDSQK